MSSPDAVVVIATIEVKPGSEEQALEALKASIPPTHEEGGCLRYALHQDRDEPTRFVVVERWASEDALEAHGRTPHLQQLFGALGGLVSGPPTILRTRAVVVGDPDKGAL